jgi:glyoxylase-like metal-dependent hydrolase (beta-lactamase superfamily II)
VTDVILSHLHFDHISWVSADGRPFFPNATIHAERIDIDAFLGDDPIDESAFEVLWGTTPAPDGLRFGRLLPCEGRRGWQFTTP